MIAVLLAHGVGQVLGLSTWAVAVLLVVALVLGTLPWFGAEATTIATTALVVLTTGFRDDAMLLSRLLDTGIGVAVGLLVNFVVWTPLRRRTADKAMDRIDDGIGALLTDMSAGSVTGARPPTSTAGSSAPATSTARSTTPGRWCARPRRAPG